MSDSSLALYCSSQIPNRQVYTKTLSQQLNLRIEAQLSFSFPYFLVITDSSLELHQTNTNIKPLCVDFLSKAFQYRCLKSNKENEQIAKAVGIKSNKEKPSVIDATAGLGKDAFILAYLGCRVHCLERSPIVAALLQDGINRLLENATEQRLKNVQLSLTPVDAITYLKNLTTAEFPDVIYLDPMFPVRRKSGLVKKEMRILRKMAGFDSDAIDLLEIALQRAKKRVVVKRPRLAAAIEGRNPDHVYEGSSSRFDLYINHF